MPEIKVECDCGQRFKLDVSPVNGRMPYILNCPLCNADCTLKADEILGSLPGVAQAPMATVAAPARPGLRMTQPAHQPAPSAYPVAQPYTPGAPVQGVPIYQAPPPSPTEREPNLALGILGAVLGGILGMVIWYLIYKVTGGWRIGLLGIGVGVLTGYGARLLGKSHGVNLGVISGIIALFCIVGSHYIQTKAELAVQDEEVTESFNEELADAKTLVAAVPNGTDEEIKAFLKKEYAEGYAETAQYYKEAGQTPPALGDIPIEPEEIAEFRTDRLEPAKDLVSGKRTEKDVRQELEEEDSEFSNSMVGQIIFWVFALGVFNLVSTVIGVGSAYKIGAGEND